MKVLHKAKQLLQGFVLPRDSFSPRGFLPHQPSFPIPTTRLFSLLTTNPKSGFSAAPARVFRRKSLRIPVFATLSTAILFSLFFGLVNNSANANTVSSVTNECQFVVSDSTGVSVSLSSGVCFVRFTSPRTITWTAPVGVNSFNTLVIAGGGGGGADGGSGGGSGSMYEATVNLNGNTGRQFAITVGGGGSRAIHIPVGGETDTRNASAGGSSSIAQSNLGFSITANGGQPGSWPQESVNVAGGAGGSWPVANQGSFTLSSAASHLGRTGATTGGAALRQSGYPGEAGATSSIFGGQFIGSGGSGAHLDNNNRPGGDGGAGGGGRGAGGNAADGWADYHSSPGSPNTGGGGGGGARHGNVGEIWLENRLDQSRNGAFGGSGAISISYDAPSLAVSTGANGARVGADIVIQPTIQLRNSANGNLAASGVVVTAAVTSGTGNLSGTTATTVSGVAQFTNLRFTSGALGSITLTYSAPGYENATQTINLQVLPTRVTISAANNSNGNFVNGVWFANSQGESIINASTFASELAARNVTVEAQYTSNTSTDGNDGSIFMQADIGVNASAARTLTLRASKSIYFNDQKSLEATNSKVDVILWADTDSANAGMVQINAGAKPAISTRGGHLVIGGGSEPTSWNGLTIPSGRAAANTAFTGSWFGVELYSNVGPLLNTAGGNVRIHGTSRNPAGGSVSQLYGVYWQRGEIATGSGSLTIDGATGSDPSVSTNPNYGVGVGVGGSSSFRSVYSGTGGLTIRGTTVTTSDDHQGVTVRFADFNAGASTVTIQSDRRLQLLEDVSVKSRFEVTSDQNIFINGAQSWTGSSGGRSAVLTSTGGSINVGAAISSSNGLDFVCNSGTFNSSSSGTINSGGNVDVACSTVTSEGAITSSGSVSMRSNGGALTTSAAINAAGPVNLESQNASQDVSVNAGVTLTGQGNSLTVKSRRDIFVADSVAAATNGGPAVFWSRSASTNSQGSQTGEGRIRFGNGVTVNTSGGAIVLAGSSSVDSNGLPNGAAYVNATAFAIQLGTKTTTGTNVELLSGGGQIRLYGETGSGSSAKQAFAGNIGPSNRIFVNSGTGTQDWRFVSANTTDNVYEVWGGDLEATSAAPANPSTPAINFYIRSISASSTFNPIQQVSDKTNKFIATGTGNLNVEVTSANATPYAVDDAEGLQFLANGGAVNVNFGANGIDLSTASATNPIIFGAVSGSSSTSNVSITADRFGTGTVAAGLVVRTSGQVAVQSAASIFSSDQTLNSTWSFVGNSGLTIGKTGNTRGVTVSGTNSVAGNLNIIGGAVTVSGAQTTTGSGNIVITPSGAYSGSGVLNSAGALTISGGTTLDPTGNLRAGGNITLTSSAKTNLTTSISSTSGEISVTAGSTSSNPALELDGAKITTTNNRISLTGTSTSSWGIYVKNSSLIQTVSGDINITGVGATWGMGFSAAAVLSTSGDINIDGGTRGIVVGDGSQTTTFGATASTSASGDITVLGDQQWSGSTKVDYKTTGNIVLSSKASDYISAPTYNNHTFTGAASVTIGNASSSRTLTVDAVGTIQGPFNVYSQYVLVDAGTSLTTNRGASGNSSRNIGVLLKATDRIELQSGAKFTSRGSDIVVWSDSDNNGVGAIHFAGNNILTSNGGDISIGGGLDDGGAVNTEFVNRTSGDGHPDNYANGVNGWSDNTGVEFLGGYQILSGGGNIFVAGRGSAVSGDDDWGVLMTNGLVYSGSGKIALYGRAPASCEFNWHRGIATGWGAQTFIISESPASDAVYVYGNTASCNNTGSVYASAVESHNQWTSIATPNGGGITIYGVQGNASATAIEDRQSNAVQLRYVNLISNTGPISIQAVNATSSARYNIRFAWDGNSRRSIGALGTAWNTGFTAYPTIAVVPSTSNVILKADTMQPAFADFRTSGHVKFEPNTTFVSSEPIYLSSDWGVQFPVKVASLTVGAPGTSGANQTKADIDLIAVSSVGPINVYGKNLSFEGALSTDATSGTGVRLKATGSISGVANVTTQGADAVFWTRAGSANSSTDEGELSVSNSATISTNGGRVIMAGSTDVDSDGLPSGDIYGNAGNTVSLGTGSAAAIALTSGNGDIRIYGRGGPSAAVTGAFQNNGTETVIDAGSGRADLRFTSSSTADNVFESWGPFTVRSTAGSSVSAPAIKFQAVQTNSSSTPTPIQQQGTYLHRFLALGGGDIAVSVTSARAATYAIDFARHFEFFANSGQIAVDFGANGIDLQHATLAHQIEFGSSSGGSSSSNITIIGDRFPEVVANSVAGAVVAKTSGTVTIVPSTTSFSSATAADTTFDSTWAFTGTSGLTIGKSGNTGPITMAAAPSVAGDLNFIGGTVTVNGNQTTTGSGNITVTASGAYSGSGTLTSAGNIAISSGAATVGAAMQAATDLSIVSTPLTVTRNLTSSLGTIHLKSTDNIVVQAGSSTSNKTNIQTSGGDITIQSDSDGNNDGYVWIQNFANISTGPGAGNILISGGATPSSGFATAASGDGMNRGGLHFGTILADANTNPSYADGITLVAGTGDITLRGKAIGNSQGRGILLPLSSTEANKSSITGKNVTLVGNSEASSTWYGIELGMTSGQTSTTVKTLISATGTLTVTGTSSNFDGVVGNSNYEFVGNRVALTGSGPRQPIRLLTATGNSTVISAGVGGFAYSATKSGTVTNDSPVFSPSLFSSSGQVSMVFDASTSTTAELSMGAPLAVTNTDVTIRTNNLSLTGSINAGTGAVKLQPFTNARAITAGTDVAGTLSVTATELATITATTLRLETGGDLTVTSNLTFTNKVSNLAIRAGGNVSAASNLSVVVANLGIDAGGNITWPGTGHNAAVIALNAGASGTISFGQSANYSVAAVDGIDPEFGLATKFVLSNVDRTNTVDRFMAVTFNPPPAVVLQDKFNNPLASNNLSASAYVVRSTMSVTRTDSGTLTLDGSTPTSQGGTSTFTTLRVNGGTGLVAISYSAVSPTGTALVDASTGATSTSINYLIRAGEPASIDLTFSSTTTRAGLTGLSPTATLKDSTGGTLTSGEYKNATVTITMTGDTNRIISGATAPTTDGVARFPNLVVAGTEATNGYTLTFSVSFRDSTNVTKTVSRSQVISITAGTPTTLAISSTSQTVVNRATLSDIALTVRDDYGNAAAFGSPTSIAATISAGANLGLTPSVSGTTTRSTDSNTSIATFSGLSLSAKVDTYTLTFASSGLASTTHTVRVTHGAAANLVVSAPSTAANDRNFGSNVVVDIVDLDGNVVTSGSQSTQTISLTANTTLTGTRAISATAGRATFTGLRMLGTVGTKVLTSSISSPSNISTPTNIVLGFGDATRLVISTQASGFVNRVAFSTQPAITAQDSSGNTVTNFSPQVSVTATRVGGGGSATITGTLTRTPGSGIATFTNLRLDGTVGQYDLTFGATGVSSTTQRVTLTHGAATAVVLTGATTASNATDFDSAIVVQILDANQNLVTSGSQSSQSIILTASGAVLTGTTTRLASSGTATFDAIRLTGSAGNDKVITATILSPETISGTRSIDLAHGVASQIVLTTSASQAVSRQIMGVQPVLSVRDVSGNPVSDFVGRVSVAVSRASTGIPFALTGTKSVERTAQDSGPTFTFAGLGLFGSVGDYTLSFTAVDSITGQNLSGASQSVTLAHGVATNLLITALNSVRNAVALANPILVEIRDQDGNKVTSSSQEVTLEMAGVTISADTDRNAVNGLASFDPVAFIGSVGPKVLVAKVTGTALTEEENITLTFGDATKLAISQTASRAVNRVNFLDQPIIVVQDVSGNLVDDYISSVSIAVSRAGTTVPFELTGTGSMNAVAGVASFSGLGLYGEVGEFTLTYSSGSLATTSQTIRLTHGAAYSIDITGPATANSGADLSAPVVVTVFDEDANPVTSGSLSVALTVPVTVSGQTTRSVEEATATFTNLRFTSTTGVKRITATLVGSPSINDFYDIDLQAGLASQLQVVSAPTTSVNRQAFGTQPVIRALDATGNLANSFNGDISITVTRIGGGTAAVISGTALRTAVNGQVTFESLGLVGEVGNYTLTYSSSTAGVATTSHTVALTHGVATQLSLVSGVTSSLSRQQFGADSVIQVLDASGNAVTNFTGEISVAVGGSNITLSGTTTRQLTATSQRNFDDLELFGKIGTYTLTFSSGSLTPVTQSVELAHGDAANLELAISSNAVNDEVITDVVVRVEDADGNLITRQSPLVTLNGTDLTGTLSRAPVSGIATFPGVKFLGSANTKNVSASTASPVLNSITKTVSVSNGIATQMVLTTAATGAVNRAGIATVPVVTLRDISGNTVLNSSATVTITRSPGDADLSGTVERTPSSGVVTFNGLGLNGKVGQYTLTYSSGVLAPITQKIDLTHGAAVKLAIVTSADTSRSGIDFGAQPLIEIRDQDNNRVTTGESSVATVTVTRTGSGSGIILSGGTQVVAVAGQASFTNLRLTGPVDSYSLEYSSVNLSSTTQTILVLAGLPASIKVVTGTTDRVAGTGFANTVSVELLDGSGNRVLSDSLTDITATLVASSDVSSRDVSRTTVRVTNGLAEFSGLNYTLAGDHKISFTDGTRTTVSGSFTITHAVAAKFDVVSQPTSLRSDIAASVSKQGSAMVIRVLDQFDNPVLSGNSVTVTATVTGSNAADISAISGATAQTSSGTEVVTLADLKLTGKAGNYVLNLAASAVGVSYSTNRDPIALTFGVPSKIVITQSAAVARAGSAFGTQPKLEIRDSAENVVVDSTLSVTATVDGRQMVGVNGKAASAGVVTFVGLGVQGVTATDVVIRYATNYNGTPLETTQKIDVTAGLASKLQIIQQPTTVMTKATFSSSTSVRLLDAFNNPVPTDSSSTVSIELLKGQLDKDPAIATGGGPVTLASATAVNGVATFTGLTLPVAPGTDYFLKFTIGSFSETSTMFEVLPGVVASLEITLPRLNGTALNLGKTGDLLAQQPHITLRDADNYVAKGASGTVSVAISSGDGGSLSSGVTTVTISDGVARFEGVRLVGRPAQGSSTAETYRLTFSHTPSGGSAISSPESAGLSVKHGDATKLSVEWTNPTGIAGRPFGFGANSGSQPVVRILDAFNNIVETGDSSQLQIGATSSPGNVLGGTGITAAANQGVATFDLLSIGGLAGTNYSINFYVVGGNGSIAPVAKSDVTVTHGPAYKTALTTPPVSAGADGLTKTGQVLAVTPVVQIQDFYGNVVLNSSLQVSVTLSRVSPNTLEPTDHVLNGKMAAVNGVASFTNLRIIGKPGDQYVLTFNAAVPDVAISDPLALRHGDPFSIKIATEPGSLDENSALIKTGSALYTKTVLHLLDEHGNLATEIGSETSVSAFVSRGGGTAITDAVVNGPAKNMAVFSSGVATFNNLTLVATPGIEQFLKFETTVRTRTLISPESAGVTLTHADPDRLVVLTQPCAGEVVSGVCSAGITGRTLVGQPVIEVQDRFGNRVTNFQGTVSVATTSSEATLRAADGQVLPSVSVLAVNGVASFSDTNLRLVALPSTPANLRFTSGDLTAVTSQSITVLAAEAKSLAMISQPVGARTGALLAIAPVVELRDEFGNRALSDDTSRVTVSVSSGVLSGTLTVTATAGRVTFSDLEFTAQPDLDYVLTFSDAVNAAPLALIAVSSDNFTVSNAVASALVIMQQPVATMTGELLDPIVVQLRDRFGNPATTDSTTVIRVSIHGGDGNGKFHDVSDNEIANPASSTLLRIVASNGVVTFDTLRIVGTPRSIGSPTTPYRLIFTANPDSQVSSERYQSSQSDGLVLAHNVPSKLSVISTPTGIYMAESALNNQPVVHLLDRYNNLATSDSLTRVVASIYTETTSVMRSGTVARAVNGVVTFSGLTVGGKPGDLYKLRFTTEENAITIDETTGFRLKKVASIDLSYGTIPTNGTIGEVSFSPSASVARNAGLLTDSPGTPTFSSGSTSPSICTVNSSTGAITVNGVGNCDVTVSIAVTTYFVAASTTVTLTINKAPQQTLNLTNATSGLTLSNPTSVVFMNTLQLGTSGGSGNGEVFFLVAQGTCRVAGTTLILGEVGSVCRVAAYKDGDDNYEFISSQLTTISITRAPQTALEIGNDTTIENGGDVKLVTFGGSGNGQVTYQVDPDYNPVPSGFSNAACSIISGDVLRASANGKCRIFAIKAESRNHSEVLSSLKVFTFAKAKQTVSFTSPGLDRPVSGDMFEPQATSTADTGPTGLAITYSITQGSGTTCRFDAVETSKIRFIGAGLCEITATQGGTNKYIAASATMPIQVGLRIQTITFGSLTPRVFGEPAFLLNGTASSGLPVVYSVIAPVSDQACRVTSSGLVTIQSAGTCGIRASQPGNNEFSAAPNVTQILTINPDRAGAPHLISVSASDQTITAHFTTPSYLGGVSSVLRYRLEATRTGTDDTYVNWACPVTTPLQPCQISGLPLDAGQTYTVQVAAVTAAGAGAYSRPAEGIRASKATSAVSNLVATSSSSQLELEWDAPQYIDGNFEAYEVYVWPLNQLDPPAKPTRVLESASDLSISIEIEQPIQSNSFMRMFSFRSFSAPEPIPQAGAYNIKIVTVTDKNVSALDDRTARGVKIGFTTPGAPDNARITPVDDKLAFGWSAPTFDGGHPVLGYIVMLNGEAACRKVPSGGQEVCENSSSRLLEVSNLKAGTTYELQVAAVNQLGVGEMFLRTYSVPAPVVSSPSGSTAPPGLLPTKPVDPPKPGAPPKKPGLPPPPVAPVAPAAPAAPSGPSDPGAAPAAPGTEEVPGAPVDDDAPPVPFDPLATPEGVKALTDSLGNAAAVVGAIAAAAAAAAAAAGGGGGSGSSGSGGQGNQGGSIATIDTAHERFTNRRRGRGDKWKIWKKKWLSFSDKFSIATVIKTAKFSPLFSKVAVDGAYLRAAFGSLGLLPTVAAAAISVMSVAMNEGEILTPQWQWFIVLAVIGIFDAFAGLVGTLIFVVGTVVISGGVSSMDDVRLLLGVIIVGYGPALLANAFRAFRKEPEEGEEYWWERLVDLVVLPFIGGWVTATMISILPALAGTTMAVANHVTEFAIAIAIAITLRVVFEEFVGRWFPARLDTLHPTDVDDPVPAQKWVSVSFRLAVFIFVTAALMGNVWQVWVGSALFILPTIIGFYAHRFRNFPWIWRIMPTGIPGLAFALIVASVTTSIVSGWFGSTPDLALWSFALLPIPMLGIAVLAMIGREGNEGEIRWIRRPGFKWVYRIGGIVMLLATMELAGVLDIFPF